MRQITRQVQLTATELATRLTDEATSPRGVLYDVPLDHAQVQAAGCGIRPRRDPRRPRGDQAARRMSGSDPERDGPAQ